MARQVQCSNCKNKFDKEDLIEYGKSKRLCAKCYKAQEEMDALKEYICKFYNMEYVSPKLQKQINELVNLHNYRPKAIKMIMEYAVNIEKFEVDTSLESITFVNYFKHDAIKYYTEKKAIRDSVKNCKKPTIGVAYTTKANRGVVKNRRQLDLNFDMEE